MDVTETDLPGVGKRFEVDLRGDETAVVLIHNNGRRELFSRPDSSADAKKLLELSDREARTIGSLLEGAHFQPIATDTTETTIGEDGIMLEWYTLDEDAELVGMSIGTAAVDSGPGQRWPQSSARARSSRVPVPTSFSKTTTSSSSLARARTTRRSSRSCCSRNVRYPLPSRTVVVGDGR